MNALVRNVHRKLVRSGATQVMLGVRRSNPVILMYHGIGPAEDPKGLRNVNGMQLRADVFVEHLKLLRRWRKIIPLGDMVQGLEQQDDMRGTVAITFDDGYENNFSRAAPILADFKAHATFFLATGYIGVERWMRSDLLERILDQTTVKSVFVPMLGKDLSLQTLGEKRLALNQIKAESKRRGPEQFDEALQSLKADLGDSAEPPSGDYRFMSWEQVRSLAASGMAVGAHTVNHPILSTIPIESAIQEIRESREQIRQEVGHCSPIFCYPNGKEGEYPAPVVEYCREHFSGALSTLRGHARREELFELRRLGTSGGVFESNLEWTLLRER